MPKLALLTLAIIAATLVGCDENDRCARIGAEYQAKNGGGWCVKPDGSMWTVPSKGQ